MLQNIDWNTSAVDPHTVVQQAKALQGTLENATADKAQDLAFLQQLAAQATQLAQSAGGAGQTMEQAYPAAPPAAPPAKPGLGQRMRGGLDRAMNWIGDRVPNPAQMGGLAESDERVLTASMGSAQELITKSHSLSQ